ncbi:UNVERIFIED_CONTAM: hypothetical protein Sradi_3250800 [Sesamum radiatum]|uniref:Uncharacterized protein n=1 Tax=Sesamum radiatum TaxID=300843 RepID=A0AAW2R064_SESRA
MHAWNSVVRAPHPRNTFSIPYSLGELCFPLSYTSSPHAFWAYGELTRSRERPSPLACPVRACQLGSHSLVLPFAPSTKEISRCRNASLKIFKAKKLLPGGELERWAAFAPVRTEEARFS